jgi:chromosome segregation ATPase
MNDLIKRLNDTYEAVEKKNKELEKLTTTAREQINALEKIKSNLDAREISLNDRELKVSKIENVVEAKKEAERILDEAKKVAESLKEEKEKFRQQKDKDLEDIRRLRDGIDSCNLSLKEREAKLVADREALEREKLNYKVEIIRQMDRK